MYFWLGMYHLSHYLHNLDRHQKRAIFCEPGEDLCSKFDISYLGLATFFSSLKGTTRASSFPPPITQNQQSNQVITSMPLKKKQKMTKWKIKHPLEICFPAHRRKLKILSWENWKNDTLLPMLSKITLASSFCMNTGSCKQGNS